MQMNAVRTLTVRGSSQGLDRVEADLNKVSAAQDRVSQTSDDEVLRQNFALTVREGQVLLWIAKGKSNRDIGEILGLSARTVNKHLEQIYVKLGVENRASAAVKAANALRQE